VTKLFRKSFAIVLCGLDHSVKIRIFATVLLQLLVAITKAALIPQVMWGLHVGILFGKTIQRPITDVTITVNTLIAELTKFMN